MRVIIVDDEVYARKRITNLLDKLEDMEVVAECSHGTMAIEKINTLKPDLVFLDINIRDMDGFEVLRNLQTKPLVVFITAHEDFAVKAFDFDAFDYLVKPFSEDRFFKTMEKISRKAAEVQPSLDSSLMRLLEKLKKEEAPRKIAIKQGNKTLLVPTDQINYILSSGVYAEIYTDDAKYVHRESLNNLINQLNDNAFLRVHRSAIINLNAVKEIVHHEYSEIDAKMKDNTLISVSKAQKKDFLTRIGVHEGN
jgi:two-component system LytT family response regulator